MCDTELTIWLDELERRRWSLYFWPNRREADLIAAVWRWEVAVDVIAIHDAQYAIAWRTPVDGPDSNPLVPDKVTWYYRGSTAQTVRGALTLAAPGREQFPYAAIDAPPECRIPPQARHAMTFRPGSDGHPVVMYTP